MANSLFAVEGLVADRQAGSSIDGLELDIGLSSDGVPILAHDPWVDPGCTREDERVLLKNHTATELLGTWRCGSEPDSEHPDALRPDPPAPLTTLTQVLEAIAPDPGLVLYLDLKIQDGLTLEAERFAQAVATRWTARGLANPLQIEVPTAAAAQAVRASGVTARIWLGYPPYYPGENWTAQTLAKGVRTWLRLDSPQTAARVAGADGVVFYFRTLDRASIDHLDSAGLASVIFPIDDPAMLDKYCRYPATVLISDDPDLGGCPRGAPAGDGSASAP